ncbi:hypothetical protein A4X13_0g5048 [Tilletia indica]|uniref:DUF6570 domain-containing protein n=1 Tax=Tilletia indica TaxID=43049 RepID=A0A8T8SWR3_9BASI|nr:hypothetical protein A4X13_0g5048 [Tilletia indica]
MNIPVDEFHGIVTSSLRSTASHYFPNQRSGRMKREGLVALLLDNMVKEKISHYTQLTRRYTDLSLINATELDESVRRRMEDRFTNVILSRYRNSPTRNDDPRLRDRMACLRIESSTIVGNAPPNPIVLEPDRPQPISANVTKDCFQQYRQGIQLNVGSTCAVCARRSYNKPVLFQPHVQCVRIDANVLDLDLLRLTDEHIIQHHSSHFHFGHELLDGLALDRSGIHIQDSQAQLDICLECKGCLTGKSTRLPALALANGNIRGYLPPHLQDITWLEERLCARYLASAYVIRLYDLSAPGAPEHRPRVMKGHACSFPLNTVSTATKLPWGIGDGNGLVSCLVIGPRAPRIQDLQNVFKVRRKKVSDLLDFLRKNFLDFPQWPTDEVTLNQLPEDDVPELLMRSVLYQEHGKVFSLFEEETTGLELHPALSIEADIDSPRTFLEHHGMLDVNGTTVPGHARLAAALANATGIDRPDLIIRHGATFVQDYKNPALFPGMFPTLFPWGTGGFESDRTVTLSLKKQASHRLDLADSAFRRHWS